MTSPSFLLFSSALLSIAIVSDASDAFCRNAQGEAVDWWAMYKLPDMNDHHSQLVKWGVGYLYLDARSRGEWELGRASLNSSGHALARTLGQYYAWKGRPDSLYLLYNDDHPTGKKDSYRGHSKAVHFYTPDTGFWLTHSVPRFPHQDAYSYPQSGSIFGQSLLCVSLYTQQSLGEVVQQIYLHQPSLYASQVPAWANQSFPLLADIVSKKSQRKGPYNRTAEITSAHGTRFRHFAKHKKWGKDLYADMVAPGLRSSLYTETWMNGPGDLPSVCGQTYQVHNLLAVKPHAIRFNTTKDHSKFAVSTKEEEGWVCVGDINRQHSQDDRGGGSMCFRDKDAFRAYHSAADRVECCPGGRTVASLEAKEASERRVRSCAVESAKAKAISTGIGAAVAALWNKLTNRVAGIFS